MNPLIILPVWTGLQLMAIFYGGIILFIVAVIWLSNPKQKDPEPFCLEISKGGKND